jgi:hypothetical protein
LFPVIGERVAPAKRPKRLQSPHEGVLVRRLETLQHCACEELVAVLSAPSADVTDEIATVVGGDRAVAPGVPGTSLPSSSRPALEVPRTISKAKGAPRKYQSGPSSRAVACSREDGDSGESCLAGVGIMVAWVSRTNCSFLHYCGRLARRVGFCSCTVDSASQASRSHMSQGTLASA